MVHHEGEKRACIEAADVQVAVSASDPRDAVISAAVLCVTAFRLKDRRGLLSSLRFLTRTVTALERAELHA